MYRIGIDVMSGDNPPSELIDGCVQSTLLFDQVKIFIVGDKSQVTRILNERDYPKDKLEILHSDDIISMDEHPAKACRTKKTSSVMIGMTALRNDEIDAFFSPGSTGASLAGSLYSIGRLKGVKRPAIGVFFPTQRGWAFVLDVGANMDCHYKYLKQFAIMGVTYYMHYFKVKNPRLGLLNIGEEESKGNDLTLKTYKELEKLPYNFVGNIEPAAVIDGGCDVLICDGFVGNILLKSFESVGKYFLNTVKSASKEKLSYLIGSYLLKSKFLKLKNDWDARKVGGAPLLGIAKPVFIGHGNTNCQSIQACVKTMIHCLDLDIYKHVQNDIREWS